jgi:hypothetical protein
MREYEGRRVACEVDVGPETITFTGYGSSWRVFGFEQLDFLQQANSFEILSATLELQASPHPWDRASGVGMYNIETVTMDIAQRVEEGMIRRSVEQAFGPVLSVEIEHPANAGGPTRVRIQGIDCTKVVTRNWIRTMPTYNGLVIVSVHAVRARAAMRTLGESLAALFAGPVSTMSPCMYQYVRGENRLENLTITFDGRPVDENGQLIPLAPVHAWHVMAILDEFNPERRVDEGHGMFIGDDQYRIDGLCHAPLGIEM